jgi:hypothetical protein
MSASISSYYYKPESKEGEMKSAGGGKSGLSWHPTWKSMRYRLHWNNRKGIGDMKWVSIGQTPRIFVLLWIKTLK